jgi:sec-independent protein translocase protein TatC
MTDAEELRSPEVDDDDGMLRMSILDHLDELRTRMIRALTGFGAAYLACMVFSTQLWNVVKAPLDAALQQVHGKIIAIGVMEKFTIIWMSTPLLAAVFLSAPWVIYQVWAFIAPGLYARERRWAAPVILSMAGLFFAGGVFGYFVVLRNGLIFLLGIDAAGVEPDISIAEYFGTFVNVMLGISLTFELPAVVFFLTLLRIVTPGFLLRHSRHAVLMIVILAAVITPSPDPGNMMLFAAPMVLLYFLGVFASYLLVLRREKRRFPWKWFAVWLAAVLAACLAAWLAIWRK